MKVKELIARLEKYSKDDEIIVAYWAKDDVDGFNGSFSISNKRFQQVCDDMEDIFFNDIMEESDVWRV